MQIDDVIYDWNTQNRAQKTLLTGVELCDETLRDGIQSPSVKDPSIDDKRQIITLMDQLGIHIANIGLPGAGKRAERDVLELAKFVRDEKLNIKINCAARTMIRDIEPIVRIRDAVGIPIVAYCFLGSSPIRQYAEDWDFARLLKSCDESIRYAVDNQLEVAFVTEDTTRSTPETLEKLFRQALSLGASRLVLCDTVGHATPNGVAHLVRWTKNLIKDIGVDVKLDWHGHNDRGLAVCNALFAAEYGCDRIHGTCLGIGERVGNASIDQIIINLKLLGVYSHDVSQLAHYIDVVSEACHVVIPPGYPMAGLDAFRTATGVHAAAVIKAENKANQLLADLVYSAVPASWFGKSQQIEIGPMSGLSNVKYWLKKRQIIDDGKLANAIFQHAKLADQVLSEGEIYALINSLAAEQEPRREMAHPQI